MTELEAIQAVLNPMTEEEAIRNVVNHLNRGKRLILGAYGPARPLPFTLAHFGWLGTTIYHPITAFRDATYEEYVANLDPGIDYGLRHGRAARFREFAID